MIGAGNHPAGPEAIRPRERSALSRAGRSSWLTSAPWSAIELARLYDCIGGSYRATRRPDPRIAALIHDALGDARSVVNVGAGTGAYEPTDREVLAVEPSQTMIAQRPCRSAPVIQAGAEKLPLPDDSFDAALAVNTVHHWTDLRAGLRELRRVARKRIVICAVGMRRETSRVSFLMCPFCVRVLVPSATTHSPGRLSSHTAIRSEVAPAGAG